MLKAGEGERRDDCALHVDCLGRFVRVAPKKVEAAHCPTGCKSFAAHDKTMAIEHATYTGSSATTGMDRL